MNIDYDEGYSMRDIDNNWLNSNMEYDKTDSVNGIRVMDDRCMSFISLQLRSY